MTPEINTIFIGGVRIDEPIVTITDLVISVLSFYYYYKLSKKFPNPIKEKSLDLATTSSKVDGNSSHLTFFYFKYYFLVMGIATAFGGIIGHAFLYAFTFAWKLAGWVISMIAIMLIERAAIEHTRILLNNKIINWLRIINVVEFVIFLGLTFYFLDFFYVELHTAYGLMVVLFSLELLLFIRAKNDASKLLLMAVILVGIAAFVFMGRIVLHQWFNHMALSHVFMSIATVLIYKGVMKIDMSKVSS